MKSLPRNYCIDCSKEIGLQSTRCHSCVARMLHKQGILNIKDKNNPSYIDGRTLKLNHCKDCGKQISWSAKRCSSCSKKGKLSNIWKDGKSLKKYYCSDCDRVINWATTTRGKGKCCSCAKKGNRNSKGRKNGMFGKIPSNGKREWYKGIVFRSTWETTFAQFLTLNNINWIYEPKAFDLGDSTYRPDFYIPEWDLWIEIKGWWRDNAKKKFKSFKKLYPKVRIKLLMKKELQNIGVLDD